MIISASRRTDIPAFYHRWFMNRIREGFILTRNPFNASQIKRVSLEPQHVDAIVFWTRNAEPLIKHLPKLSEFNYYFQYTITGYPKALERHLPSTYQSIETFMRLSDIIGPSKIIWRYDPILVSNLTPLSEHKRKFHKIASLLAGKTYKVVISFVDLYTKTEHGLKSVPSLNYRDLTANQGELNDLCMFMVEVCQQYNLAIETCAEGIDLTDIGIQPGKCIDDELLKHLFGIDTAHRKNPNQRTECSCVKSIDIGSYNTCLHGCKYCYATYSETSVQKNRLKHDPNSSFLLGGTEDVDKHLLSKPIIQQELF
ncbi:DUF1848 domain-containing protein [Vibrio tubiashii]|uniref:DUF1848 domain-containing protein n=1 Tax=Vibrio tubiashii TaxID=29498 RepID=UPI001EFCAF2F|nr:DUF1848 domain-containing protein [Vibrio tubiashii]MCG9582588.1 DUF1848 domain-containing protein [Vibrio tubiashii]MCG9616179.1 DUF1848 domain-containing protein [Vibrio tubiashii]MCG9689406.1 DUF1848 domain-containing protein [Vibrio tubiashii]